MQSSPSCPNCTRNFRGFQSQGPQERSHERANLLPLLLRCGHTFCSGCVGKFVKLQKTNITCPECQVNTPMPLGEASVKSLPPDYYRLGQVMSNYKQLNDLIHQKSDTTTKPVSDVLKYEGKLLKACPGRELCGECRHVLATCSCRQCDNAVMCNPCYERLHNVSKMMQSHIQRPFTKDRCIAKCPDHGEEEKYFCSQDDIAICGHCAIIGDHKGHTIVPISDQTKEAFSELPTALDKGVASLKKLYYAKQAIHKAKLDARKDTAQVLDSVSSTFASQISLLQMRSHHILEIVHNNCTDQLDRLTEMEQNIVSNIAILEGTIEDASYAIKMENDMDANLLRMLETLTSEDLPCHYVVDQAKPPMAAFTFDKDFTTRVVNFGTVGVDSNPRGDLKSENELPDDYEQDVIKDDILKNSNAFKMDQEGALKIREKIEEQEDQAYTRVKSAESNRSRSAASHNRGHERVKSPQRPFKPETKALVRLVHIRNPCYFFVQREADALELGNMMTRINQECNRLKESERKPDKIAPGVMCCAKYLDGRWYRAKIKRILEPASAKKPESKDDTKKSSKKKKSSQSSDAENSKEEHDDKAEATNEEGETENKDGDEGTGDTKDGENDMAASKDETTSEDTKTKEDENTEDADNEESSTKSSPPKSKASSTKSSPSHSQASKAPEKPSEPIIEVLYVDFGNTELVTISKLCKLRSKLARFPEMAVCCSLVDIVPNNQELKWSADVNQGFARIVGQSIVQMSVQASAGSMLYVDLHKMPNDEVEDDMPVSLRDALVFLELACFRTPESVSKGPWHHNNRTYLGADLPKSGESINATISHINNPGSFYVQEIGDDMQYLLEMMKDLQNLYKKRNQEKWGILCPQIGMICVAKFELDQQWYRAQIIGLPGKQRVEVVYVDYGNQANIHFSDLRKVSAQFVKLPVQALPCLLADVEPMENPTEGWPEHVAGEFFGLVAQKTLKVFIKTVKDGCLNAVLLYEEEDEEKEKCANAELVRHGHARSNGPSSTVLPFGNFADTKGNKQVANGIPTSSGTVQSTAPIKKKKQESAKGSSKTKADGSKKPNIYTKVHVSHIESPACIYVQLASAGKDGLDSLLEAMTLHYKETAPQEENVWQEGDICCALLVREKVWCRAKMKTVLPDENAVVLFSDYGNTEIIELSNVCPLEERFQQLPPFAIQCHLADVIPAGDKQKWTKTACEFLIAKLADLECCIVKKGELVAGSLPIDLLYEMSIEEKLERETIEDLFSISKLLKQKGLAFAPRMLSKYTNDSEGSPSKSKDPAMQPLPPSGDSDSDFLSDAGEGGDSTRRGKKNMSPSKLAEENPEPKPEPKLESASVNEESNKQVPTTETSTTETSTIEAPTVEQEILDRPPVDPVTDRPPIDPVNTEQRLSPPVVVLDSRNDDDAIAYKPRLRPTTGTVELVITYVDADCIIYGVHVDEVDKLQKLVAKLQAEMVSRPPSTDVNFYKGQAVCANFTQDGLWYRAKVLGGTQQGVKVHYIDFGNTEITASDKIQPIAFEPDIRQKSQGCKLMNLFPKEPHSKWPPEIISMLLESLLEQTCTVEIQSICIEGKPWRVDLKLADGRSLRQVLLDMGYAREGTPSDPPSSEDNESDGEIPDGSSEISSSVVSSGTMSNDVHQIIHQDIVPDQEEEKDDEVPAMWKYSLAGTGISYNFMRLPEEGVYFGAQVTQVDRPDLLYIQIVPSPAGNSDPTVHRSAEELYLLGELIKELNKIAPHLPPLDAHSIKHGQVCCALYDVDHQYYRGKIIRVRDQGERLIQVQYVDYGNSEWHTPESLRQIPDKFVNLPAQARQCKIVGIKPPKSIPKGEMMLPDTRWPVKSGKRMVELVNDKQLVGVVKYDSDVPGIHLFESESQTPLPDPRPGDWMPLHMKLVSDMLAELDSDQEDINMPATDAPSEQAAAQESEV